MCRVGGRGVSGTVIWLVGVRTNAIANEGEQELQAGSPMR